MDLMGMDKKLQVLQGKRTNTTNTTELQKSLTQMKIQLRNGLGNVFYEKANIPLRFKGKTLANFKGRTDQYKNTILNGKSIFITGSCGTGKTHLAIALATEWFAESLQIVNGIINEEIQDVKGYPLFLPATEFFLKLKTSFNSSTQTVADILDNLDNCKLLLLDDFGTDKVSDWSKQIIYTLIDRRYRNMQQIIITSNLSLKGIAQRYDDRIASRLAEMGSVVEISGSDKRVK